MTESEWLEPDGLGGFAMGTADGIRTRRYHALLCTATEPPGDRFVLVADLEVFVTTPRGRFALSAHRYAGGVIDPDGATRLAGFVATPWPTWRWQLAAGAHITCELAMTSRVVLRWTYDGAQPASLSVRPLLAGREFHATHHENPRFDFTAIVAGERVSWRPYPELPAIAAIANGRYDHAPDWYRRFELVAERDRGLDAIEDLATPGSFTFDLAAGSATLAFAAGAIDAEHARDLVDRTFAAEAERRRQVDSPAGAFIVARGAGKTVIAGYPWFGDWGRDTFIALRGLTLATGRRDDARAVLLTWARVVDAGMVPNRFAEQGAAPDYNSVDAALWFAIAAADYLDGQVASADRATLEAAIDAIVAGYVAGTRHRIAATDDGLLAAGEPGLQLTWMDAKVGDEVITPRIGKPVEVNALWLNAVAIAGARNPRWRELYDRGLAAFTAKFWDPSRRQLYDVIDCDHVAGTIDASVRPNQIFAVGGLPLQLVDGERARAIVDAVERDLLTPVGLRTLSPHDPRYRGRYVGGPADRDRAYHQGTVWPWLLGPFVEAWVRVRGATADAKREARERFVVPLRERFPAHVPELCDGDRPHAAAGCPFQAWSLAELVRLELGTLSPLST